MEPAQAGSWVWFGYFITDAVSYQKISNGIQEIIDTDLLGIYAMSVHISYLLPLLRNLKKINERVITIWGGPHAMLFPEQTAKSYFADIVARCEGEDLMLEIAKGYETGKLDLHKIKGITFEEDGVTITTPDRDFVDMDTLPFIDWSFIKKDVMEIIKGSIIRVQASRGCPYRCAFCINVLTNNRKMRYRSPSNILDEIEHLCSEFGITRVGFRDELFLSNRKQAKGLIDRDIRITWIANPRVEYLKESYIDDEFLKLIANSGCNRLQCGGESGSQRILDLLRKGIRVEDILNFVKRTKKFNIYPVIPTETDAEQMQTLALIREIIRIQPKAVINGPANFRPYPGGELYNLCVREYGLKMPTSLEEWARAEILGGTHPPWVKKLYFNQYIWTSIRSATYPAKSVFQQMRRNPLKGISILLLGLISRLRLRYLFYKLPLEFRILDLFHRYILKKIPDYS